MSSKIKWNQSYSPSKTRQICRYDSWDITLLHPWKEYVWQGTHVYIDGDNDNDHAIYNQYNYIARIQDVAARMKTWGQAA